MLPRLEMRHLAMLVGIADAPSMSAAAELLGLTQSALSHRLREAERRLGSALFHRGGRRMTLTPAGERVVLTGRRLLADLLRCESDVAQIAAAGITDVARLGQAIHTDLCWLPGFHAYQRRHLPHIQVELPPDTTEEPLQQLVEGSLDLAILAGTLSRSGIRKERLFRDQLVAVLPPGHPLAAKSHILPGDLTREVFLSAGFTPQPGFELERFMLPEGAFPLRAINVGRPEASLELTAAGQGISIRTRWVTRALEAKGRVVTRPLGPQGLPLDWFVATREGDGEDLPGPLVAAALRDWCAQSGGFDVVASEVAAR